MYILKNLSMNQAQVLFHVEFCSGSYFRNQHYDVNSFRH